MRNLAFVAVALLASLAGPARAQDYEAAGRHFSAAQEAFSRKHFKVAATEYQSAFDITKDPLLLYNIGESWQKAGDGKKSVAAYKQYLKAQPQAQDKTEVQKRIKAIEVAKFKIDSQSDPGDDPTAVAKAPPPPPAPTPPPPPPVAETPPPPAPDGKLMPPPDFDSKTLAPPDEKPAPAKVDASKDVEKPSNAASMQLQEEPPASKMRVAAWIGVAATVAVLTTGAILGLAAQSRADEITRRYYFVDANGQPLVFDATQQSDFKNLKDEGNLYNGLAIGFFAGAGALAVATAVLFGVDYKNQKDREKAAARALRFQPSIGPNGGGFMTGWHF